MYITKPNIDCKDGEACHTYTDDNLTLEEADNRIICHIGPMMKADYLTSIKVKSADTDVIVILLAFMPQIKQWNDHVIIEYGVILELVSIGRQFPSIQSM